MLKDYLRRKMPAVWPISILAAAITFQAAAQTDQAIYTDALQNSWQDWGWATINYANNSPVHSGTKSISVTFTTNTYQAIYIHHSAFDTSAYTNLTFWIHGGAAGGQQLQVKALLNGAGQSAVSLSPLAANTWQQITLSLASLGAANRPDLTGFWIQDRLGSIQPTFYLDGITLIAGSSPPATNSPVSITVNAALNRHPISDLIYGVAFATSNQLMDLNFPLNRCGGNGETRYNWLLNAHNHAADWYFESLADSSSTPGAETDNFVTDSKNAGAQSMVTIPMIEWMPKLGPGRQKLSSYSIAKYGLQAAHDSKWFPDAGNGVITNSSTLIMTNDPNDANFPSNSTFQQGYVQHLTNRWGMATNGGVRFYIMDNEHSLWHSTHRDVHPIGATMQEIRDRFFDYATMVKSLDPDALVVAPEEWGWPGYFYSGYDRQWSGLHNDSNPAHYPDRGTNGGWDYMPWLLNQIRLHDQGTDYRLLDYFTLHIYPQGGESGSDVTQSTQLLRNRSTRSLWDTNYVDQSWINQVVKLIPRMKEWVNTYYPGTKIGITEYNWGAENHINGATTQADILGIFGREGLDLATRWKTPDASTPACKAMKLYRNYDGNKSTFGDISVSATGPNPDSVSTFAAVRSSDGALTVMVINKQLASNAPVVLTITNFLSGNTAQMWQLTSANTISQLSDLSFSGNVLSNSLPAQSITLFVLPPGNAPQLRFGTINPPDTFNFRLDGRAGQLYAIQSSSDLVNWLSFQTNTLASNSQPVTVSATNEAQFFRAQWLP